MSNYQLKSVFRKLPGTGYYAVLECEKGIRWQLDLDDLGGRELYDDPCKVDEVISQLPDLEERLYPEEDPDKFKELFTDTILRLFFPKEFPNEEL